MSILIEMMSCENIDPLMMVLLFIIPFRFFIFMWQCVFKNKTPKNIEIPFPNQQNYHNETQAQPIATSPPTVISPTTLSPQQEFESELFNGEDVKAIDLDTKLDFIVSGYTRKHKIPNCIKSLVIQWILKNDQQTPLSIDMNQINKKGSFEKEFEVELNKSVGWMLNINHYILKIIVFTPKKHDDESTEKDGDINGYLLMIQDRDLISTYYDTKLKQKIKHYQIKDIQEKNDQCLGFFSRQTAFEPDAGSFFYVQIKAINDQNKTIIATQWQKFQEAFIPFTISPPNIFPFCYEQKIARYWNEKILTITNKPSITIHEWLWVLKLNQIINLDDSEFHVAKKVFHYALYKSKNRYNIEDLMRYNIEDKQLSELTLNIFIEYCQDSFNYNVYDDIAKKIHRQLMN